MSDDVSDERWLPIEGHEGRYEVSDQGRVRGLPYYSPNPNSPTRMCLRKGKVLGIYAGFYGYAVVSLSKDSKAKLHRVHLLVARAFIGAPPDGQEVRHLNGDPLDARLANLAYGTHHQNMLDMIEHGRGVVARTVCPRSHLLVVPNIVESKLREGHRKCKACNQAKTAEYHAKSRGEKFDLQQDSDERYAVIIAGGVSDRRRKASRALP